MLVCEEKKPAQYTVGRYEVYHLGMEEFIEVAKSAELISTTLGLNLEFIFGHGKRGWVGDNPFVLLDVSKIKGLGWSPKHTIVESISETADWLRLNDWIFDK